MCTSYLSLAYEKGRTERKRSFGLQPFPFLLCHRFQLKCWLVEGSKKDYDRICWSFVFLRMPSFSFSIWNMFWFSAVRERRDLPCATLSLPELPHIVCPLGFCVCGTSCYAIHKLSELGRKTRVLSIAPPLILILLWASLTNHRIKDKIIKDFQSDSRALKYAWCNCTSRTPRKSVPYWVEFWSSSF